MVLKVASELKQNNQNEEEEESLIAKAFVNINNPKILKEDQPIFKVWLNNKQRKEIIKRIDLFWNKNIFLQEILGNVFAHPYVSEMGSTDLVKCLNDVCKNLNIQSEPYTIEKAIQLYDMISFKNGVILLGEAFSGKSIAYRILSEALDLANKRVNI